MDIGRALGNVPVHVAYGIRHKDMDMCMGIGMNKRGPAKGFEKGPRKASRKVLERFEKGPEKGRIKVPRTVRERLQERSVKDHVTMWLPASCTPYCPVRGQGIAR